MQFSSPIVTPQFLHKIIKINLSLSSKKHQFKNMLAYAREFFSEIFQNSILRRKESTFGWIYTKFISIVHYFERVCGVISQAVSILIVNDKESRHIQARTIPSKRIEWLLLEHRIKNTNASNSILLSHNFSYNERIIIITLLIISFTTYLSYLKIVQILQ